MVCLADVAIIAKMALRAEFGTCVKTSTAFPAVRSRPAVRWLCFNTAKSAFAKPIAKAICTAIHAVVAVLGKHRKCKQRNKQAQNKNSAKFFHFGFLR